MSHKRYCELLRLENARSYDYQSNSIGLNNVSITVRENEILGILCDYHDRKSDIALVLSGLLPIERFKIFLKNKQFTTWNYELARKNGIYYLNSLDSILPDENVAFNIFFTDPPPSLFINNKNNYQKINNLLSSLKLAFSSETKIRDLSISEKLIVIILREYFRGSSLLVLDNICSIIPSSSLKTVHHTMKKMNENGMSFLLCDDDVSALHYFTDRIYTLNKGCVISKDETAQISAQDLIKKTYKNFTITQTPNEPNTYAKKEELFCIYCKLNFNSKIIIYKQFITAIIVSTYNELTQLENVFANNENSHYKIQYSLDNVKIGFVQEKINFYKNLSIYENVILPLEKEFSNTSKIINKKRIRSAYEDRIPEQIRKKLEMIAESDPHLEKLFNRRILTICRELVKEPDILILTNIFYRLSSISSKELIEYLILLNNAGISIVFLSNEIPFESGIFDQIITV